MVDFFPAGKHARDTYPKQVNLRTTHAQLVDLAERFLPEGARRTFGTKDERRPN